MKLYPTNEKTIIGFKSLVFSGSIVSSPSQKIIWGTNGEMNSKYEFKMEKYINNEEKI